MSDKSRTVFYPGSDEIEKLLETFQYWQYTVGVYGQTHGFTCDARLKFAEQAQSILATVLDALRQPCE